MIHRLAIHANAVGVVVAVAVCEDAARVPHPEIVHLKFDDLHRTVQLSPHECHVPGADVDHHLANSETLNTEEARHKSRIPRTPKMTHNCPNPPTPL